jgi:ABC-2 type transport system ATP-binding protein
MVAIQNASLAFNGKSAVSNLSLSVQKGEIMGLLGANGAGKSTTINMLLGFLKPDRGSVQIDGMDAYGQAQTVRKRVGYIPENVNLYPYLSGTENLDYFCRLAGTQLSAQERTACLNTCGLQEDAHNKRLSTYSKGMRQKVGIAIAYAKQADVYLLDEPASGLDPVASNELSRMLKKLAEEGAAVLMASHDLFRVREACHHIGILKDGELIKTLGSASVSANELESIYLEYMTK